ncbi:MAG: hypothetical protein HYZ92_00195 [Candidatus Omnitrophica bacterium]|nr:hypothetical protein [Candidatus Omnitrophota bacterium]
MSPDGSKTVSPEERLLRLIRGKGRSPAGAEAVSVGTAPAAYPASRRKTGRIGPGRWIGWFNLLLVGLLTVELVVLVVAWLQPPPEPPQVSIAQQRPDQGAEAALTDPLAELAKTPSLVAAASRPLFHAETIGPALPVGGTPAQTGPSEEARSMASRLSLIGIVAGASPQAIIEDAQTHKTYFVAKGQTVVSEIVVVEVRDNRVILELRGEKIELTL